MKMDKSNCPLSIDSMPNADTTVMIPITIGRIEATTLPNASNKTSTAMGNPIASALAKSF